MYSKYAKDKQKHKLTFAKVNCWSAVNRYAIGKKKLMKFHNFNVRVNTKNSSK